MRAATLKHPGGRRRPARLNILLLRLVQIGIVLLLPLAVVAAGIVERNILIGGIRSSNKRPTDRITSTDSFALL